MDWVAFRAYLLVDEGLAPQTVEYMLKRVERAGKTGLDLEKFLTGPDAALETARNYLSSVRASGHVHAYNNYLKALKGLARSKKFLLNLPKIPEPKAQPDAYSPGELEAILSWGPDRSLETLRGRALVRWALHSGMRRSEIAAMQSGDLDATGSRFLVRQPAKRGRRRWLPIESAMWSPKQPFGAWLRARPLPPMDPGAVWVHTPREMRGAFGHRMGYKELGQTMWQIGKDVGVAANFVRSRHTRATMLLKAGLDIRYIQVYLGHANLETTARYAEATDADVLTALKRAKIPGFQSS